MCLKKPSTNQRKKKPNSQPNKYFWAWNTTVCNVDAV